MLFGAHGESLVVVSASLHVCPTHPVAQVINLLRQMQGDPSLRLEWQGQIEAVIHTLARAKLHDLFVPSAVRLTGTGGAGAEGRHSETEMVEQILGLGEVHFSASMPCRSSIVATLAHLDGTPDWLASMTRWPACLAAGPAGVFRSLVTGITGAEV